jgi:dolichyl-phosphate beta-glucosyltransferase
MASVRAHSEKETRSVSIVVPAYNEEVRLEGSLRAIHKYLDLKKHEGEILAVDDGSSDGTLAIAERLRKELPRLRVLGYATNRGKGSAVRTGIMEAVCEAVLVTDADLSAPIQELDRLWPWYDLGYPVVIASRHLEASRLLTAQPVYRQIIGRLFNFGISLYGVRGFRDTQCGFKLFHRDRTRPIFSQLRTDGFAFDVEVLLRARRAGLQIVEVPVRWTHAQGSRVKPLRDGMRMLAEIIRMRRYV